MMRAIGASMLLLVGCKGGSEADPSFTAGAFVPPDGRHQEYTPADDTAADPLMLRAEADEWTMVVGESWATGTEIGRFTVRADADGLWAADTLLLPDRVSVGATGEGVEVTAIEEHTTYYGTFDLAVTVEIESGAWAGTQVLARGFGPVTATLDGETWDLVYYE